MTSFASILRRVAVTLCALVIAAGAVLAGDPKSAKRYIDSAKSSLEQKRFEAVADALNKAESLLQGVDEATAKPLKEEIASVRQQAVEGKRAYDVERVMESFNRNFGRADESIDEWDLDQIGIADRIDAEIKQFTRTVLGGEQAKALNAEEKAIIEKKFVELRAKAVAKDKDAHFHRVNERLDQADKGLKGESDETFDRIEQYFGWAREGLAKAPKDDPRHAQSTQRLNAQVEELKKQRAQYARDEAVKKITEYWQYLEADANKDHSGWESEAPPTMDEWTKQGKEVMPLTTGMYQAMTRFFDDGRAKDPMKTHGADPEVKKVVDQATALRDKAAANYVAGLAKLMEEAKGRTRENPRDLLQTTKYLADRIEHYLPAGPVREKGTEPVKALIKQIETEMSTAEANRADLEKKCIERAAEMWEDMLGDFGGFVEMDPVACVEDIEGWKGKLIRIEKGNFPSAFQDDNYDMCEPINGRPVAFNFDEGVRAALKKCVEATGGLGYDSIEDMVAVVDARCRSREYQYLFEKWIETASYDAPLCRIVAFKAGPYAISAKSETCNISEFEGMPEIEVKAAKEVPGGSGGGGFFGFLKWVFGCGCCLVFLGALGGGGYYFYMQQQKAKAAGGDVAKGAAPAEVPPGQVGPASPAPPPGGPAPMPPPPTPPAG